MKIIWTEEKKEKVLSLIEDYINEHRVSCGESVMQMDNPQVAAPELMADIVDIIEPEYDEDIN